MKITSLHIHGIRSFIDASVTMRDYTVFVGENNSGKSNLLFALLWFFGKEKLSKSDLNEQVSDDPYVEVTFALQAGEKFVHPEEYLVDDKFRVKATAQRADIMQKPSSAEYHGYTGKNEDIPKNSKLMGWKNVAQASFGELVYIPSVHPLSDELKLTTKSSFNQLVSNYVIARMMAEDEKAGHYRQVSEAIASLSTFMKTGEGSAMKLLKDDIASKMLSYDGVELDFDLEPPVADELIKSCIRPQVIVDGSSTPFPITSQGDGFQRSMIFSLLTNLAELTKRQAATGKKNIKNNCTYYLIEEPEIFLHPNHQMYFRNKLEELAEDSASQVLIVSHSPYFLNYVSDFSRIKRVTKEQNVSKVIEISTDEINSICKDNGDLMARAKDACRATQFSVEEFKSESQKIAEDDHLRYLLWIDPTRANAYLSKKVILVEGPTEKAFFAFMFNDPDGDFYEEKETSNIAVIDTVGKYHFYKFARLLHKLGVKVWCVSDEDEDSCRNGISHKLLNEGLTKLKAEQDIQDVFFCKPDLEALLGIEKNRVMPDISLYSSLRANVASCRSSEGYKSLVAFASAILSA